MGDYFSDWEYYSDDYYDDDPTVKQSGAAAKEPTKSRRTQSAAPRSNNRVPRPQSSIKPDITSFQGVVWKTASLERDQDIAVQIYEPGHGDKVALLEDWREIFKSAQPALDKSRLRKRKAREMREPGSSLVDDGFPCDGDDDDQRQDSSDQMSHAVSLDNMTENGSAGDVSNTTPELMQSPKEASEPTITTAKRGRKRKAEVPPAESNKDESGSAGSTNSRSKRVAARKGDGAEGVTSASSGPVRRSTRQKK